jgi:fluoride ion exporter CrcB/FEX
MITIAAIALGAFIGAPLRALVEQFAGRTRSALTTLLIINSLGSLLAGFSLGAFTGDVRTFFITGLAGAFTTFSGWALALNVYSRELVESGVSPLTRFTRMGLVIVAGTGIPLVSLWLGWLVSEFLFVTN